MKLRFIRLIKHSSWELVLSELEAHLQSEAWEIWRANETLIALGVGSSTHVVNLSDRTSFSIGSFEDSTTIEVLVDFQAVRFLSQESQILKVRRRHEAILTHVCERLNVEWEQQELPGVEARAVTAGADLSKKEHPPTSSTESKELFVRTAYFTTFLSVLRAVCTATARLSDSAYNSAKSFPHRKTVAVAAVLSLCVAMFTLFSVHLWNHRFQRSSHTSAPSTAIPSEPARPLEAPHATTTGVVSIKELLIDPTNLSDPIMHRPEDVRLWIADWAASERTKDAGIQTTFYADNVSPYLGHASYSRTALYHDKQDAIRNRRGLWTFSIEKVSIHRQSQDVVQVNLTKHFMMQSGGVKVSEQWVPSHLVLTRIAGMWRISAEKDHPSNKQ